MSKQRKREGRQDEYFGTVRIWHDEEGWGVIDSSETPGGCWAHWSVLHVEGFRALTAGGDVILRWERAAQDGYDFRALAVRPAQPETAR